MNILSLGAGVQSSTILYMSIKKEIEKPDLVIFADTGWEPKNVYEHVTYLKNLCEENNILFKIVKNGNIKNDILSGNRFASLPFYIKNKDGSAGISRRQCTNEYKIIPINKYIREFLGYKKGQRIKQKVNVWKGISIDEIERIKPSALKWINFKYPLIDKKMNRFDCINWCEKNGYKKPPKSSCIGCPFHSNHMWLDIKRNYPNEWKEAVEIDQQIKKIKKFKGELYLHNSLKPLDEVFLNENQLELNFDGFINECGGYCGV
jgi:hypothetical protein